jgi:ATP-dependent exoDNAse (exonuclease V) beta subunit
MPYFTYNIISKRNDILWIQPQEEQLSEQFSSIPLFPIKFNSEMPNTSLRQTYYEECTRRFLDTLNLTYVAFTRPQYELYLFSPLDKAENDISRLVYKYVTEYLALQNISDDENVEVYQISNSIAGKTDWTLLPEKEDDETRPETLYINDILSSTPINNRLTIQEIDTENTRRGNILHQIMSQIKYHDDIDKAISKVCTGTSSDEKDDIKQQIIEITHLPQTTEWFQPTHLVMNEFDIITPEPKIHRPDRVMLYKDGTVIVVDYKFTGRHSQEHIKQVKRYMFQLRQALPHYQYEGKEIQTQLIKGYLLYADSKQIVEIK